MKSTHDKNKCESCHFEAENGIALKTQNMESSSVGFMFSNERQVSENLEIEEPVVTEGPSKKRKTKSDYLRGVKKLKATKSKRT